MPLPIHCRACGFRSTGVDGLAGKTVKCRQCDAPIQVPRHAPDEYGLAGAERSPSPVAPRRPAGQPLRFAPLPGPSQPPRRTTTPNRPEPRSSEGAWVYWVIGGTVAFLFLAGVSLVLILAVRAGSKGGLVTKAGDAVTAPIAIQATLPAFPEIGQGALIEPGIMLHEIHLPPSGLPGHRGKLWLYLPSGALAGGSLPCVMITGAGSNLLSGAEIGEGSRPEHLPYVREGFAVLAYELDGNTDGDSDAEMRRGYDQFRAAQAGLVNARIALEFLLAKVPAVDRSRIFTAGHSSAGTLSLLFAEHEPRLAGSIAYAPAIDLEARFGSFTLIALGGKLPGLRDFVLKHSPKNHEAGYSAPVFLFHAEDDSNVPIATSRASVDRLKSLGKSVTLEAVPTGDHYDSMIQQGIPRAIAWLKSRAGNPPSALPTPPPPPAPFATNPPPAPFVLTAPSTTANPGDVPFTVAPPAASPSPPATNSIPRFPRRRLR